MYSRRNLPTTIAHCQVHLKTAAAAGVRSAAQGIPPKQQGATRLKTFSIGLSLSSNSQHQPRPPTVPQRHARLKYRHRHHRLRRHRHLRQHLDLHPHRPHRGSSRSDCLLNRSIVYRSITPNARFRPRKGCLCRDRARRAPCLFRQPATHWCRDSRKSLPRRETLCCDRCFWRAFEASLLLSGRGEQKRSLCS